MQAGSLAKQDSGQSWAGVSASIGPPDSIWQVPPG